MKIAYRKVFFISFLLTPALFSFGQTPLSNPFEYYIKQRKADRTLLPIAIEPASTKLTPVKMRDANGNENVIGIPVKIRNQSKQTIRFTAEHEWYGGIWPHTDLLYSSDGEEAGPAYQVGERDTIPPIELGPGKVRELTVRLNWKGTGSVASFVTIFPGHKYSIRFLLFFQVNGVTQYVETKDFSIEVAKK